MSMHMHVLIPLRTLIEHLTCPRWKDMIPYFQGDSV